MWCSLLVGLGLGFLDSVFSAGGGRSSVEAWYTTALDIEEVLTGATDSHIHLFVADVVKSFDTVDRSILDRVLSSLGLPVGFVMPSFSTVLMLGYGSSSLLDLANLGLAMGDSSGLSLEYDVYRCFVLALV